MKNVYRVLAYLVAFGVVVQAAAIAYGMFGLIKWVEGGGTLDQSTELNSSLGGFTGFSTHGMVGMMVLPVIILLFLISSFFAKVPGGVKWALFVFAAGIVQIALGLFSHEFAGLGWLHGANALVLFALAVMAGMRVRRATADRTVTAQRATAGV